MALGVLVPLKLEHVFDLRVSFGEELPLGPTSLAHDRVFHLVTGGTVSGPRLVGILVPNSGSDAPCRSKDRAVIEGEWLIRAADGTVIRMVNSGYGPGAPMSAPWRADVPQYAGASRRNSRRRTARTRGSTGPCSSARATGGVPMRPFESLR